MRNYIIKIFEEDGVCYTEWLSTGNSAMEAFENGIQNGEYAPSGFLFDVEAKSEQGVIIHFQAQLN